MSSADQISALLQKLRSSSAAAPSTGVSAPIPIPNQPDLAHLIATSSVAAAAGLSQSNGNGNPVGNINPNQNNAILQSLLQQQNQQQQPNNTNNNNNNLQQPQLQQLLGLGQGQQPQIPNGGVQPNPQLLATLLSQGGLGQLLALAGGNMSALTQLSSQLPNVSQQNNVSRDPRLARSRPNFGNGNNGVPMNGMNPVLNGPGLQNLVQSLNMGVNNNNNNNNSNINKNNINNMNGYVQNNRYSKQGQYQQQQQQQQNNYGQNDFNNGRPNNINNNNNNNNVNNNTNNVNNGNNVVNGNEKLLNTRHLWIGDLPHDSNENEIRQVFGRHGKIMEVRMLPVRQGKSACFIAYATKASATKCIGTENFVRNRLTLCRINSRFAGIVEDDDLDNNPDIPGMPYDTPQTLPPPVNKRNLQPLGQNQMGWNNMLPQQQQNMQQQQQQHRIVARPPSATLFFPSIPASMTDEDIQEALVTYGPIQSTKVIFVKAKNEFMAYVTFESIDSSIKAKEDLEGKFLWGQRTPLRIEFANDNNNSNNNSQFPPPLVSSGNSSTSSFSNERGDEDILEITHFSSDKSGKEVFQGLMDLLKNKFFLRVNPKDIQLFNVASFTDCYAIVHNIPEDKIAMIQSELHDIEFLGSNLDVKISKFSEVRDKSPSSVSQIFLKSPIPYEEIPTDGTCLEIKNVRGIPKDEIARTFFKFGNITKVSIIRGIFYLIFESPEDTSKAVGTMNGGSIGGFTQNQLIVRIFTRVGEVPQPFDDTKRNLKRSLPTDEDLFSVDSRDTSDSFVEKRIRSDSNESNTVAESNNKSEETKDVTVNFIGELLKENDNPIENTTKSSEVEQVTESTSKPAAAVVDDDDEEEGELSE